MRILAGGRDAVLHVEAQHRLGHDAGVASLQPVVPPAQLFAQEADGRPGLSNVRILVRPGADEALPRSREVLHQAEHAAAVAVGPARDGVDRHLDRRPVLADAAVAPEGVAPLVRQPGLQPQPAALQPLHPHLPPGRPHVRRIGRQGVAPEHDRGPGELFAQRAAAHVVDVVGIAVVGRAERDDGLQRGRAKGRDLQPVEPAPGDADHAHLPVTPGLIGDPGDGVAAVLQLLRQVFVLHQPLGVPCPAQVQPHHRIAVPGQIGLHRGVAQHRVIVLAVGDVFEDRGNGRLLGPLRHPDARCKARAVRHRHRGVQDLAHLVGKLRHDPHGPPPPLVGARGRPLSPGTEAVEGPGDKRPAGAAARPGAARHARALHHAFGRPAAQGGPAPWRYRCASRADRAASVRRSSRPTAQTDGTRPGAAA